MYEYQKGEEECSTTRFFIFRCVRTACRTMTRTNLKMMKKKRKQFEYEKEKNVKTKMKKHETLKVF